MEITFPGFAMLDLSYPSRILKIDFPKMLIYRLSLTDAARISSLWKLKETFPPVLNKGSLGDFAQIF